MWLDCNPQIHVVHSQVCCGTMRRNHSFNPPSLSALTELSKSIALYLHDENSSHRVLAIDLCSKGFHVWQNYIDTMEILRALFSLATGVRKETISVQNIGAQARLAVLTIATQNTPLFMSTLCLDVLNPPSLEHRRSVLQIIAFLIRKVVLSCHCETSADKQPCRRGKFCSPIYPD